MNRREMLKAVAGVVVGGPAALEDSARIVSAEYRDCYLWGGRALPGNVRLVPFDKSGRRFVYRRGQRDGEWR